MVAPLAALVSVFPDLQSRMVRFFRGAALAGSQHTGSLISQVDDSTLAALMAEVSDPAQPRKVLRLSLAAARADGHLADGEALVVGAARQHWQLVDGDESLARPTARRRSI